MSGSVEVREFLLRYDGGSQDSGFGGVPTQRAGQSEAPRISDDQVRRARRIVARGAVDVEDCARMLDMLGLKPDRDGRVPVQW